MPAAKPFGSVARIHRELQGKTKEFSAAKRKRIFRVLGFAAAAMLGCALISSQVVAQSPPPATFTSASLIDTGVEGYYTPGATAQAIAGGDFNGDGKPDLIAIGACCAYEILLGNGNGTFSSTGINTLALRSAGDGINANNPNLIAVGDFNGDGKLDFAVYINGPQSGANYLDVYLGDGTGHFSFSNSYTVGSSGATGLEDGVVAADVNGDGKLYLLAINSGDNSVTVLLGNGDGTFQTGALYSACNRSGCVPLALTVGDFNNDGHPDLALVSTDAAQQSGIYILLNNGNGTFQSPVFYSSSSQMGGFPDGESGIASADLNGDGNLDLVMTNNAGAWVFLGNGDGTFQAPINYGAPYADTLALADVNGDKTLDLVVPDFYNNTVWVLLGNGDGTFKPAVAYATDWFPESIVVADFNGDGKPDFAVGSDNGPMITLAFGNGDGTFQTGPNYDIGNWTGQVAADFNNDGNLDVAVYNGAVLQVMLGNSHGGLGSPITTSMPGLEVTWMAAGDVNGDGKPDLVAANQAGSNGSIAVFIGNGNGTFKTNVDYTADTNTSVQTVSVGDLNGDGKPDLAVADFGCSNCTAALSGNIAVLLGNGDGTFQSAVTYNAGNKPQSIAIADFNGDGFADLAVTNFLPWTVSILLNHGDGTFAAPFPFGAGNGTSFVVAGDLNGDGKPDLVTANGGSSDISVLLNNCSCSGGGCVSISSAEHGATFAPSFSSGQWVTIKGNSLASGQPTTLSFVNGSYPTSSNGVSVTIGGLPAFLYYLSPGQLNVISPDNLASPGNAQVVVTNNGVPSAPSTVAIQPFAPGFFLWPGNYAVATDQNYQLRVKAGEFAGATTTPAAPGDVLILWGTGFGPSSPPVPAGHEVPSDQTYNVANSVQVMIGGVQAVVYGAAYASGFAALVQVAVQVPNLSDGDYPVIAEVGGVSSPSSALLTIKK